MYAVVLVGGFGTRLRPLTNDVPKPMLPVAHRPMIVHLVERLATAGVTDVVLALGFRPEPFREAFPEGTHGDVRIHYAVEPEPLDTGGAIGFAAREVGVDDTFLVANGDVITDLDAAALVARHRAAGAVGTLHLTGVDDPSSFGVVETDEAGVIQRFVEKPPPGTATTNQISAGTYVLEPEVLDLIPELQRCSVEREVFPRLVEGGRMLGISTDDYWIDAGKPAEFLQANLDAVSGIRAVRHQAIHDDAVVADSAEVVGSVVGAGSQVADGVRITGSVLLPGARVGAGATVDGTIVAGAIRDGATVTESVIGPTYEVESGAVVEAERLPQP